MVQLGGAALMLRGEEMGWGHREEVRDVARVVSSMCDGIMARTFEHAKVIELAKWSRVPVINGLTDYNQPCQGDGPNLLTIEEHFGRLNGLTMAFIGRRQQRHALARCLRVRESSVFHALSSQAPQGTSCRRRTSSGWRRAGADQLKSRRCAIRSPPVARRRT
jgi:ornithine carbamoyltransferase